MKFESQTGLFEGIAPIRNFSWVDGYMQAMRDEPRNCSHTDFYKRCDARVMMTLPIMQKTLRAIVKYATVSTTDEAITFAIAALKACMCDREIPALDTRARKLRQAGVELGIKESDFHESSVGVSLMDYLHKAEHSTGEFNSGIESRFAVALRARFPLLRWDENRDSGAMQPDYTCEEKRITIEIDSWEWHHHRDAFTRDRQRSRLMQAKGYVHLQYSGAELSIPHGFSIALDQIARFVMSR